MSVGLAINQIGNAGVAALARAFKKGALPQLKAMRLWKNEIGDEGMKALMAAAGGGGLVTLETLDVEFNDLSAEAIEALAEAIESGKLPSLGLLRVGNWVYNDPRFARLRAACEERGVELR